MLENLYGTVVDIHIPGYVPSVPGHRRVYGDSVDSMRGIHTLLERLLGRIALVLVAVHLHHSLADMHVGHELSHFLGLYHIGGHTVAGGEHKQRRNRRRKPIYRRPR